MTVTGEAHHSSCPQDVPGQAEQSSAGKPAMEQSSISIYLLPAALQKKKIPKLKEKGFLQGMKQPLERWGAVVPQAPGATYLPGHTFHMLLQHGFTKPP